MTQNEIRMSLLKRLAEQAMSDQEFRAIAGKDLDGALDRYGYDLNERERDILMQRRLAEAPVTLEDLSGNYGVSRERIRQIEVRAFEKLQDKMRELAKGKGMEVPA